MTQLFFFAGVAACVDSWHSGDGWGNQLMRRCTRLYRPVFYYLAVCGCQRWRYCGTSCPSTCV